MPSQMQKEHNKKVSSIPTQLQEAGFAVRLGFFIFSSSPLPSLPSFLGDWEAQLPSTWAIAGSGAKPSLMAVQGHRTT